MVYRYRTLDPGSFPSANATRTNILQHLFSAEIPKQFRGYGGRPVDCAYGMNVEIRSLSVQILRTSGLNGSRYGEKTVVISICCERCTVLEFREQGGCPKATD